MTIHLGIVYGCFCVTTAELTICDRDQVARKAKVFLLPGPLQKTFVELLRQGNATALWKRFRIQVVSRSEPRGDLGKF